MVEENFDVLDESGNPTGVVKGRKAVHRDGDWHRAVHVWIYIMETGELLIQKRAKDKDSWPDLWDISAAGHVSAGDESVTSAQREVQEELGIDFPLEVFEPLFTHKQRSTDGDGAFVNNEHDDLYLITVKARIPLECYTLQKEEVQDVKYIHHQELLAKYEARDDQFCVADLDGGYRRFFDIVQGRAASGGLAGSGITSFKHHKEGTPAVQVQCVNFDAVFLKLVPPEHR